MRVLLINDFKSGGGAEVIFLKTYKTLCEAGYQVDLMYQHEKITPPKSAFSYIYSFKSYRTIYQRLNSSMYDLVYILNYSNAYSPSILYAIKKCKKENPKLKVIYNAHDFHITCPNSALNYYKNGESLLFKEIPLVKDFLFKCLDYRGVIYSIIKKIQWLIAYKLLGLQHIFDQVLCPSQFLASRIKKRYPFLDVEVLRNPLDQSSITKPEVYTKKIGKTIKLVYFGRISSEKGLGYLIENLPMDVDYTLDLYGDGPQFSELENLISQMNLSHKVFLKGKQPWDDLMKHIYTYDAFVLPSFAYENAPLSIVEAACAGLYILTRNHGGAKEVSTIVGNNFFIDPICPERIRELLANLTHAEYVKPNLLPFAETTFRTGLLGHIHKLTAYK